MVFRTFYIGLFVMLWAVPFSVMSQTEMTEPAIPQVPDTLTISQDTIPESTLPPEVDTLLEDFQSVDVETIPVMVQVDSIALVAERYMQGIRNLAWKRDSINATPHTITLDPYFYRIMTPGTLYDTPVKVMMSTADTARLDDKSLRLYYINRALAQFYVSSPLLVTQTQADLSASGVIREDIVKSTIVTDSRLSDKVAPVDLGLDMDDSLVVVTRRPNFWRFNGTSSISFSQNYYTKNWPGNNMISGMGTLVLNLSYNNMTKFSMTNNMNIRLGFQTDKSDKIHSFKPSSNSIDNNTKVDYKINKHWSYSMTVRLATQLVPSYVANTNTVQTDVFSPLQGTFAPGISSAFSWGKMDATTKKRPINGSISIAPLAYNLQYVQRSALATRYGVKEGHHSAHSFGPNITATAVWAITKTISWSTRVYWFSNFKLTRIEWENNINCAVSKLINVQLHVFPKFDDSSLAFRNESGNYILFKEYMSVGLNYAF